MEGGGNEKPLCLAAGFANEKLVVSIPELWGRCISRGCLLVDGSWAAEPIDRGLKYGEKLPAAIKLSSSCILD